ncbi:YbbR-like domain-containing protein [Victivallis sp. Marseille-Q1083]|uniref:CdaR family protein n=1 Tax=Victivallis sp. Marseille-Q1083 TaxID=2717288 RepID=UPI00158D686F|nr:CdaR family protein [Victivallis sp. Marseille-Q1083]
MYNSDNNRGPWRYVPEIIRRDFIRKVIAFSFALLLYFTIATRIGTEEKISNVPVTLDIPAGLINLDKAPQRVTVTVKGSKKALAEVNVSALKVKAQVLASNYTGVPYVIRLTPDNVKAPFGTSVVGIDPKDIVVNLEPLESRKVPVVARFDSQDYLEKDYSVGQVKFMPGEVWIRGPKSLVDNIDSVSTQPIPLDRRIIDSFEYSTEAVVPEGVNVSPTKISAEVEIVKLFTNRVFKSIPLRVLYPSGSEAKMKVELLTAPSVEVTLNGPKGLIGSLKPEVIRPYIDLNNLSDPGTYTLDVACYLNNAPDCSIVSIYPPKVQVKLTREP